MPNAFHKNLGLLRRSRKGLQKDIAQLIGVSVRQAQRYEKGEQEPDIDGLIALADSFGVSLDYLVGRSDSPEINKQ